jgi:hypothetical protein
MMCFCSILQYGFSTFAHRNRSFNILELIWQNAISEQPLSQEQLSAKVKSLKKNKSKSVENSPVTTPKHSRHQIWQLSLRGNSKTESDSSGTDSLILLPGSNTPTPSPPSTVTTLPPSGGGEAIVVPRVTVTNSENSIGALKSNHTHQTQSGSFTNSLSITTDHRCESSSDSLFADAVDGEVELSNLNSDSVVTSDLDAMARLSSSNSTDTESNVDLYSDEKRAAKPRSPSVIGLVSEPSREESENEDGITFKTRGGEAGADSGNGDLLRGSELAGGKSSALNQVLGIHPTRIGIWRLQRALQDWCTPSNFINLLIVISIFLLLISTASMVCKLSYVNPTFQPLLAWQPWCRLCSEGRSSKTAANGITAADGDYSNLGSRASGGRGHLWTVDFFEELVKKHANDPDAHDDV